MGWLTLMVGVSLGVFLTIQMLSALYSPLDHWHDIRRHRWRVVLTILIWGGVYLGVFSLLPVTMAAAFEIGARIVLAVHLIALVGGRVPVISVRLQERGRRKQLLREFRESRSEHSQG